MGYALGLLCLLTTRASLHTEMKCVDRDTIAKYTHLDVETKGGTVVPKCQGLEYRKKV